MENNIVDVEFKEVQALEDKSNDVLAAEANNIYNQMNLIGCIGMQLAAQAGERLNVIKERLPHGQWETWANENLEFSLRKAKNMMRLAREMSDKNSIFSKRQTFADIGISKVYALLGNDEEVVEKVLENPEISNMSVRELKEEIKELKEAKDRTEKGQIMFQERFMEESKKSEQLESEIAGQNDIIKELNKKIEELNIEAKKEPEKIIDTEEVERLSKKLAETEEQIKKEKEVLQKEREERKEEVQRAIDTARAENEKLKELQEEEKKRHAEELEKIKKQGSDQSLLKFKLTSDMAQAEFIKCIATINEVEDEGQALKMRTALKKLMQTLIERIEG